MHLYTPPKVILCLHISYHSINNTNQINISTASAILAAAAGCKVAKCGNRSVSSACGSADVLEMIGVAIDLPPVKAAECINTCGVGFLYAPINHPAMKAVAPIRKAMGIRTTFNIIGPITNAAGANRVVIGVFEERLVELLAHTLVELGTIEHGVVIHGCGLDEISPIGGSTICEIRNTATKGAMKVYYLYPLYTLYTLHTLCTLYKVYDVKTFFFDPLTVGVPRCVVEDLKGGSPTQNVEVRVCGTRP